MEEKEPLNSRRVRTAVSAQISETMSPQISLFLLPVQVTQANQATCNESSGDGARATVVSKIISSGQFRRNLQSKMGYLPADFFSRDTLTVARDLIGTLLVVGACEGRIVETEAYTTDAASHSVTRPNQSAVMQTTSGHVYVYFIYGMYYCLNFTTDSAGAGAVLIRAAEPTRGLDVMKERRGIDDMRKLASGPGRLCEAFGIDLSFNRERIGRRIKVKIGATTPDIAISKRIGISRDTHLEWRFYERNCPFVSK